MARGRKPKEDDVTEQRTEEELEAIRQKKADDKRDRFLRLASPRVTNALRRIGLVENMANKTVYTYTDDEAKRVKEALLSAVGRVCDAFDSKPAEKMEFQL